MENIANANKRLCPVKEVPNQPGFEWSSVSMLRHWIFKAETRYGSKGFKVEGNGFGPCVIRIGGKVLIDLDELDKWVESHRMSA